MDKTAGQRAKVELWHGTGITGLAIEADAANAASIRVAEKCDFQRIGSSVRTDVDRGLVTTIVFARQRP
jgi:RimJ/RimL family protein N-acetyltransferase